MNGSAQPFFVLYLQNGYALQFNKAGSVTHAVTVNALLSHLVFLILIEESVPDVDEEDLENSACSAFPHMY